MNKYNKEINLHNEPNTSINTQKAFDLSANMEIPGYSEPDKYVPEIDKNYHFDEETTLAILAGFKYNRRVLVQGLHGTGKSTQY